MQSQEFVDGFLYALELLGDEGDHRGADWSAAYKYLQGEAKRLKKSPTAFGGLKITMSKKVPAGTIEFHHSDGRVDRLVGLAGVDK